MFTTSISIYTILMVWFFNNRSVTSKVPKHVTNLWKTNFFHVQIHGGHKTEVRFHAELMFITINFKYDMEANVLIYWALYVHLLLLFSVTQFELILNSENWYCSHPGDQKLNIQKHRGAFYSVIYLLYVYSKNGKESSKYIYVFLYSLLLCNNNKLIKGRYQFI